MTSPKPILPLCICGKPTCTIPYGLCHCGCGRETTIAAWDNSRNGHRKGYPKRLIHNHHAIEVREDVSGEDAFLVDGDLCRRIPLTKRQWTIVSVSEFARLNRSLWVAHWSGTTRSYYAVRTERVEGKLKRVWMHHDIIGLTDKVVCKGDHKNGNSLDNRIRNLRPANDTQSGQNKGKYRNNTSGYKGVSFNKEKGKWQASIRVNKILIVLGWFNTREEAYEAYCTAARRYFGEFARLK